MKPGRGLKLLIALGLLVSLAALYLFAASRCKFVTPILPDAYLRDLGDALRVYARDHNGRMPGSLLELFEEGPCFPVSHDAIPVVRGSRPPTSFHYVPCEPDAPPETVVAFPNWKGQKVPLYVLRKSGKVDTLTPEEYEKEIRALGGDYDSLPEAK